MRKRSIALILVAIVVTPSAIVGVILLDKTRPSPPRIAFVMPTFSHTAYSAAFYNFYRLHINDNQSYITTDLGMLNVTVKPGWSWSGGLSRFLNHTKDLMPQLFEGGEWTIIDERDVAMARCSRIVETQSMMS